MEFLLLFFIAQRKGESNATNAKKTFSFVLLTAELEMHVAGIIHSEATMPVRAYISEHTYVTIQVVIRFAVLKINLVLHIIVVVSRWLQIVKAW